MEDGEEGGCGGWSSRTTGKEKEDAQPVRDQREGQGAGKEKNQW